MGLDLTCKECGHIEKIEFTGPSKPELRHALDVDGIYHKVMFGGTPINGTYTFYKTKE